MKRYEMKAKRPDASLAPAKPLAANTFGDEVLDCIPNALVVLDKNACYRFVNQKAARLLHRNHIELIGKHIWTEFPELIGQTFYQSFHRAMAERCSIEIEEYFQTSHQWCRVSFVPCQDGLLVFYQNITDQKHWTEVVHMVVRSLPCAVAIGDSKGRITLANDHMSRLFGYSQTELVGRPLKTLIPHRFRSQTEADSIQFFADVQEQPTGFTGDLFGLRRDGTEFPSNISVTMIRKDEHLHLLVSFVDSVDHIQTDEFVQHNVRMISLGKLFASIAHEINNPLNAILMSTYIAQTCEDNRKPNETLSIMLNQITADARRCGRIVNSILTFAKQESSEKWPGQFRDVMLGARNTVHQYTRPHPVQIEVHCEEFLPAVNFNPMEMELALVNILLNAADYGAQTIYLSVKPILPDRQILVTIQADGHGMTEEQIKCAFDPFYPAYRSEGTTGVGLSISQDIIADHGGELRVFSEIGQGMKSTFTLPVLESEVDTFGNKNI